MMSVAARPKSANPRYNQHWNKRNSEVEEELHRTSSILWASNGADVSIDLIERPKTSNPVAEKQNTSEVFVPAATSDPQILWADISPVGVPVVRPATSNPRRENESESIPISDQSNSSTGAVLWSSDGGLSPRSVARPHTYNSQLVPQDSLAQNSCTAGSEVLWSSEGHVDYDLVARPHAINKQLERESERGDLTLSNQGVNSSEVLWSADDVSVENGGRMASPVSTTELDVSIGESKISPRPYSAPVRKCVNDLAVTEAVRALAQMMEPTDSEIRNIFKHLSPDSSTDTITKKAFCSFYSSIEHFGAPHNARSTCSRFNRCGSERLCYDEFAIIMLRFASQ